MRCRLWLLLSQGTRVFLLRYDARRNDAPWPDPARASLRNTSWSTTTTVGGGCMS